jgi:Spy/CpxP family protein refolding chaperone
MKFLIPAALLAVLALPVGVCAQQSDQSAGAQAQPSDSARVNRQIYRRWSQLLSGVNLTDQQHEQIQNLLDQYSQNHPAGSPPDRPAARALKQQIFSLLTPDQQTQVRQQIHTIAVQAAQRRLERLQQQNPPQANPEPTNPPNHYLP